MISQLTIAFIFGLSLAVALLWGVRWAYVAVFLPVLILLNQVPGVSLQHAPVLPQYAPMYAILIAIPFRRESLRFRICSVDVVIAALLVAAAVTGWTTEYLETGVNAFRNDLLRLGLPYFLARAVFKDWTVRRGALRMLAGVLAVVAVAALVEFRASPYFYLHMMQRAGFGNPVHAMAYQRYGFYRVAGPVEHPIFFGNMCVVLLGMVAVLARTSGVPLRRPWVATTLFAALGCVVVSISFTPYMGVIAGSIALGVLMAVPLARRMLLPLTLAAMAALFSYTYYMATTPLGPKPEGQLPGSMWTRKVIIRQSWGKAVEAGPFGWGLRADFSNDDDFDLASVDNSYMQFTMTRGWVYTGLWLLIGVTFAWRVGGAFRVVTDPSQVFPLAVCAATVLGLMVSMYTVWAGALYAVVWAIMLGLGNTLIDAVHEAADARAAAARPALGRLRPPVVRLPAGNGLALAQRA